MRETGARKIGIWLPTAGATVLRTDQAAARGNSQERAGSANWKGGPICQPRRIAAPRHPSPTVNTCLDFVLYVQSARRVTWSGIVL